MPGRYKQQKYTSSNIRIINYFWKLFLSPASTARLEAGWGGAAVDYKVGGERFS